MVDALPSEPNSRGATSTRPLRSQLLLIATAAILVTGGIVLWRMGTQGAPIQQPTKTAVSSPPKNPVLDELVRTTRALNDSQQQAIDQLQVLQDTVASQAAALKASSDQVAALNARLETLRQSFASTAQPAAEPEAKPVPQQLKRQAPRQKHKPNRASRRKRSHAG
ncbi:MAG: hypothetical protein JSS22_06185 [Proteobacteria bacterium]|nr:hypothetical protein [Pseudomonadota bacterium]